MVPELLVLALEYSRAPFRYPNLLDDARPLPACFDNLVSALGGAMAPTQAAATAADLGTTEPLLRAALMAFFRQVMLRAGADHYRVLGLSRTAAPDSIAAHYHAMVGLFHPDRADPQGLARSAADTARINRAYRVLRDPAARARYDRELTTADHARCSVPDPTRAGWPVPWTPQRHPAAVARPVLVAGAGLLVAVALVLVLGQERQTLRMRDQVAAHRSVVTAPAFLTVRPNPAATAAGASAAVPPGAGRGPDSIVAEEQAARAATGGATVAPAGSPEDLIERFRRHFAAGDIQAILLLLTDDARIAGLQGAPAGDGGADFFDATRKKALHLIDLRLERDGSRQLVVNGHLRRSKGQSADTGGTAKPAGEIRLEITDEDAGYRISALLYQIDPQTPEPPN